MQVYANHGSWNETVCKLIYYALSDFPSGFHSIGTHQEGEARHFPHDTNSQEEQLKHQFTSKLNDTKQTMALFGIILFAMGSSANENAEYIRASMLSSIRRLLDMLDPLVFSNDIIGMIDNLFDEEQYEMLLWKVTYCLDFCVCEREKAKLGKLLLESWQHAISFQEIRLQHDEEEADDVRQERKRAVASCQEGKHRVQRSLDQTCALQMLRKHVHDLMCTLDEHSFQRFHQVEDDFQNAFFIDALFKLSQSSSVVKVEHRLLLLKKAWEKLYEHDKYHVENLEEICRHQHGKYDRNARVLLNEKRQDVKGCEEGIQIVEARYKAMVEAKGDAPWWHFLAKPETKNENKSVPLTAVQQ